MTTTNEPHKLFIEVEEENEDENNNTPQQYQEQEKEQEQELINQFEKLTVADGLEEEDYIDTEPLFTRYLYIINDVYVSLFDSIIKGKKQEVIFWAFELYYSGFERDVWVFLISLYKEHFEKYNSQKIKKYVDTKYEEWFQNQGRHYLLATVVSNMCVFSFVISDDLQRLSFGKTKKKIIYSTYKEDDVKKYETKIASKDLKHYRILRLACEYSTEKNYLAMNKRTNIKFLEKYLQTPYTREQLINIFRCHWEYYSYNTPVWKERIQNSNGVLDHKNKKVLFDEDIFQDLFYDNYGYEPDEQNIAVLQYCCGEPMFRRCEEVLTDTFYGCENTMTPSLTT
jgi:hypothetical protein